MAGVTRERHTFSPERGNEGTSNALALALGSDFFKGGAAQKSYALSITGDRPAGSAATGDSNDALIRASGNNYAANDTNFILRGVNASVNNRDGGTLGRLDHNLGVQGKSGGTVGTLLGLTVTAENYGVATDLFGGIDVVLKNEAAVATTEFGLRLRNENNSIAGPVAAAIAVTDTGANTGWTSVLDASGASVVSEILKLAHDAVAADAGGGTVGSVVSGAFIRVKVGATNFKVQLYADS